MSSRPSGSIGKRGRRSGSTYTWRRRKGANVRGALLLVMMCAGVLLIGPASPVEEVYVTGSWPWAWSDVSDAASTQLRNLSVQGPNLLGNDEFVQDDGALLFDGWQAVLESSASTVRPISIENTPPARRFLEIVPHDRERAFVQRWVNVDGAKGLAFAALAHTLSEWGEARIVISFLTKAQKPLGSVGWVLAGGVPESSRYERWYDVRPAGSERGVDHVLVADLKRLVEDSFGIPPERIGRIGIILEASNGQHLLIEDVFLGRWSAEELGKKLASSAAPMQSEAASACAEPGVEPLPSTSLDGLELSLDPSSVEAMVSEEISVTVRLVNGSADPLGPLTVRAEEPRGFGLISLDALDYVLEGLDPGESAELTWRIRAQRPHSVNSGAPWVFAVLASTPDGRSVRSEIPVQVTDSRPGELYYLPVNFVEPVDGAGHPHLSLGNRNAWLDPEEFEIQLLAKSAALNSAANRAGATWSHVMPGSTLLGAEWASRHSESGRWQTVLARLESSISEGAAAGHEYVPLIDVPLAAGEVEPLFSYHEGTDGFWVNTIGGTGSPWSPSDSSACWPDVSPALLPAHRWFSELLRNRGSDLGVSALMQSLIQGIVAPSSANPEERAGLSVVELQNVNAANELFAQAADRYLAAGKAPAGVHGIAGLVRAAYLFGEGDWRSTAGGDFSQLEEHLDYVNTAYVKPGSVRFATVSEFAAAHLDYNTLQLLGMRGPELPRHEPGVFVYPIRLLGKDIPIGGRFVHTVQVPYPADLADRLLWVGVYRDDELVFSSFDVPTDDHTVHFTVDQPGAYRLMVITLPEG